MDVQNIPPVSDETLAELLELEAKCSPDWRLDSQFPFLSGYHIRDGSMVVAIVKNQDSRQCYQARAHADLIPASRNSLRSIVRELQERRAAEKEGTTDTELLDALEKWIKENDYVLIHNLTGSDDPNWPSGYTGGGIGLLPWKPRTLREALTAVLGPR